MPSKIILMFAALTLIIPQTSNAEPKTYIIDPGSSFVQMVVSIKNGDAITNFLCNFNIDKMVIPLSGSFEFEDTSINVNNSSGAKILLESSSLNLTLFLDSLQCTGGDSNLSYVKSILNAKTGSKITFSSTEMKMGPYGGLEIKGKLKINGKSRKNKDNDVVDQYLEGGLINYKYFNYDDKKGIITLYNDLLYTDGRINHIDLSNYDIHPENSKSDQKLSYIASLNFVLFATAK